MLNMVDLYLSGQVINLYAKIYHAFFYQQKITIELIVNI